MKRYLKLFITFMRFSTMAKLEYRLDFIANVARSLGWFLVSILSFTVLFTRQPVIQGWTKPEALTLFGIFMMINELWFTLLFMNFVYLPRYIQSGDFDRLLLYPVSTQFMISFRYVVISTIPNLVISFFVIAFASQGVEKVISLFDYLIALLLVINGFTIIYSLMLIAITSAFWTIQFKAFRDLYGIVMEGARYPTEFFKNPLRFIYTFIVPLALIFTFPAQFLVKNLSWPLVIFSFAFGLLLLIVSHKFFYHGIRHYNSASS